MPNIYSVKVDLSNQKKVCSVKMTHHIKKRSRDTNKKIKKIPPSKGWSDNKMEKNKEFDPTSQDYICIKKKKSKEVQLPQH